MNRILYIGNNFTRRTKYNSTLTTLSSLLEAEGYKVKIASSKKNILLRLLDMCYAVFSNRNSTDYVLIDTFSTSSFYFALCTSQLARLFKVKFIPILHGGNLPSRLKKSPKFSKLIFKNSHYNIAPSNYLKSEFERMGYAVKYIPNTIELETYKFKLRNEIHPKILWVRAFDTIYNPQMAIEVIQLLKEEFPQVKLCMVGPRKDDSLKQCRELISKYKLEQHVTITGVLPKEDWHKLSEEYDLFINTTNFDNTPVSVIEAMALGLPVVSTNAGGIPYLIEHNNDGILTELNDVNMMAHAIKQLIKDPDLGIKLSKNARSKVEQFDWEKVKSKWLEVLS